jgi:hypothetical protein
MMTLDPIGTTLQISTVVCSLITTWLLSRKGKERWGYLTGFVTLPLWCIMEAYYHQWVCLILNPLYLCWWWKGLKNHWGKDNIVAKYKRTGTKKSMVGRFMNKVKKLASKKTGYIAK